MAFNSMVIPHTVAQQADAIPVDTYTPAAAQTVVALFTFWGLSQFLFRLLCLLALIRYRSAIPLLYALLLADLLGRRALLLLHPIPTTGGFPLGLVLIALTALGLILSLSTSSSSIPSEPSTIPSC